MDRAGNKAADALAALLDIDWERWNKASSEVRGKRMAGLLPWAQHPEATPADMIRIWEFTQHHAVVSRRGIAAEREAVKAAVAAHPSAPLDILVQVLWDHPDAFASNPIAPLLPLEAPDFFVRYGLSDRHVSRLLHCGHLPVSLVALIASGAGGAATPDVIEDARMHVALAGEASAEEWQEVVRAFWQAHVATVARGETEEDRQRHSVYKDLVGLRVLPESYGIRGDDLADRLDRAVDPQTPERERELLRDKDRSPIVRCAARLNPAIRSTLKECYEIGEVPLNEHEVYYAFFTVLGRRRRKPRTATEVREYCIDITCLRDIDSTPSYVRGRFPLVWYVGLSRPSPAILWTDRSMSIDGTLWWLRLAGALGLKQDKPKEAALLQKLAQDGNRLVRAAARTRLENPDFVFHL